MQLIEGCCLEQHKNLPRGSVNLALTDLPYNTTNVEWDSEIIDLREFWDDMEFLLTPGGVVVLFGAQPFTSKLVMSQPRWFKYSLVWHKNKCGSPGLAKYRPMRTHEDILVFAPPGKSTYNPQMENGEPYSRKLSGNSRCNTHGYGFKNSGEIINTGKRYPQSVINTYEVGTGTVVECSRDFSAQQQVHATQKPVPLLKWLIETYSNPGDVVLDSTMGSGSTGVAAVQTCRGFIGIEKDPEIFKLAQDRIFNEVLGDLK